MLGVLAALWGTSLRRNLEWLRSRRVWRVSGIGAAIVTVAFFAMLAMRVVRAQPASPVAFLRNSGIRTNVDIAAPSTSLVDQRGRKVDLSNPGERNVLLTFAYGHCATVCPSIVNDLRVARRESRRPDVRIAILTLDPWRDVPERLPTLAAHWKLEDRDLVLSGDARDVESALDALGIGRRRNEVTGDIDHSTTVMLLDRTGRIRTRIDGGGASDFNSTLQGIGQMTQMLRHGSSMQNSSK
jgi:cytochrome oxidase Cu insertion factor (SCO1/SenC/PrrC family)